MKIEDFQAFSNGYVHLMNVRLSLKNRKYDYQEQKVNISHYQDVIHNKRFDLLSALHTYDYHFRKLKDHIAYCAWQIEEHDRKQNDMLRVYRQEHRRLMILYMELQNVIEQLQHNYEYLQTLLSVLENAQKDVDQSLEQNNKRLQRNKKCIATELHRQKVVVRLPFYLQFLLDQYATQSTSYKVPSIIKKYVKKYYQPSLHMTFVVCSKSGITYVIF